MLLLATTGNAINAAQNFGGLAVELNQKPGAAALFANTERVDWRRLNVDRMRRAGHYIERLIRVEDGVDGLLIRQLDQGFIAREVQRKDGRLREARRWASALASSSLTTAPIERPSLS